MKNTRVVQFETRALEAESRATLARDRRAARASRTTAHRSGRLASAFATKPLSLQPSDCEA